MYILVLSYEDAHFYEAKVNQYTAMFIQDTFCKGGNCCDLVIVSLGPNARQLLKRVICFYTLLHVSGGVLCFHVGRPCVLRPSVVSTSVRPHFVSVR